MADDPYQALFYSALAAHGFELVPATRYSLAWIRSQSRSVHAFHFHWLHLFYDRNGWRAGLGFLWFALRVVGLRLLGWGVIWTIHNLESHERKHPWLDRMANALMSRLAHVIMAHGEHGQTRAAELTGRQDVVRLPLFAHRGHYPDTVSAAEARSRLALPPDAFVIVSLGKLRAYKGTEELIDAFRASAGPGDRLLIAGRPETDAIAEDLTRRVAGDRRISLRLSYVPADELQLYFRAANAAVYPYRDILTAGSIGVALTFGVPAVAPRRGTIPEAVGDGGVVYDPEQPGALWNAIEAVRGPRGAELARAAARRAGELGFDGLAAAAAPAIRAALVRARAISG